MFFLDARSRSKKGRSSQVSLRVSKKSTSHSLGRTNLYSALLAESNSGLKPNQREQWHVRLVIFMLQAQPKPCFKKTTSIQQMLGLKPHTLTGLNWTQLKILPKRGEAAVFYMIFLSLYEEQHRQHVGSQGPRPCLRPSRKQMRESDRHITQAPYVASSKATRHLHPLGRCNAACPRHFCKETGGAAGLSKCLLRSNNIVLHTCGRLPWFSRRCKICRLGPLLLSELLLFAFAGQVCCSFFLPQSQVLPCNVQASGRQGNIWSTSTCFRVPPYRDRKPLTFHFMQLWIPNLPSTGQESQEHSC